MSAVSRRGLFGLLAGAAAAPYLRPLSVMVMKPRSVGITTFPTAELGAIARKAFIPNLVIQVYSQNPMLTLMMKPRIDYE